MVAKWRDFTTRTSTVPALSTTVANQTAAQNDTVSRPHVRPNIYRYIEVFVSLSYEDYQIHEQEVWKTEIQNNDVVSL